MKEKERDRERQREGTGGRQTNGQKGGDWDVLSLVVAIQQLKIKEG